MMLLPKGRTLSRLLGTILTTNAAVPALGNDHGFIGKALDLERAETVLARAGFSGLYANGFAYLWKRPADSPGVVPLYYTDENLKLFVMGRDEH